MILFPIFGIFSKEYRIMFKKSWVCAFKRITLKPCDEDFASELKNLILGKLIFRFPRFARFLDKTASFWAVLFVIISLWSLLYTANAGLNLWVYDTCNPTNGESCALGGESCGINTTEPPTIFETLSRIPDRLKTWNSEDYISTTATYYNEFDQNKPIAVEFIDPGCKYCKKLWKNIKEAGFQDKYNITYVVYPIPNHNEEAFRFQHSYYIASLMEAIKLSPPPQNPNSTVPNDWRLLDKIFTENTAETDLQNAINTLYTKEQVVELIRQYLKEFGYTDNQIVAIEVKAESSQVKESLANQSNIVRNKLKTIKIPTIVFDGKRYDRVIDSDTLK